jgi:hypothetical protein
MTMAGLFHNEWANIQDEDPEMAETWQIKVSTWMVTNCHKTWTRRCTERHCPTKDNPNIEREEARAQLAKVYEIAEAKLSHFDKIQ